MRLFTTLLRDFARFCEERGVAVWLVGGAVRDLLRRGEPVDLDVAVDGDAITLARAWANQSGAAFVALDDERGVGRVVHNHRSLQRLVLDIVQLRAPTIEADLRLRDFTINALAIRLDGEWEVEDGGWGIIDPCEGVDDLKAGILRMAGPTSLRDDPLRALRAVRLASGLSLRIDPLLDAALRTEGPRIAGVAAERVREELLALLGRPGAAYWLRYLDEVGVLTAIFPELEPARGCTQPSIHFLPVLEHSLEAVACMEWLLGVIGVEPEPAELPLALQAHPTLARSLPFAAQLRTHLMETPASHSRIALLKLAVLLHDNAKPQTKTVLPDGKIHFYNHQELGADVALVIGRRLRLGRDDARYVALVVREHMRPGQLRSAEKVTRRAIVRFFHDTGAAGPDVLLHDLADHMAVRGPRIVPRGWEMHLHWMHTLLEVLWGEQAEQQPPLLDGRAVMDELGLIPGRLIGMILREVREAQAAGEITTREEALELARKVAGNP